MNKNPFMLKLLVFFLFSMLCVSPSLRADTKIPLTPEGLNEIKNVSDPQISPDGKFIAFTVAVTDLEADSSNSHIHLVSLKGGVVEKLTAGDGDSHSPRWSPDGKQLVFLSSRDGEDNLYILDTDSKNVRKLTASETSLSTPVWSRNGKYLLCTSRVLPQGTKVLENWTQNELPKSKARTINRLLFRQWNRWLGDERNHVFLVDVQEGKLTDMTPEDADVPPVSLLSGHDFDISPDGTEICFVRNDAPMLAISTNQDIFLRDIATLKETKLTTNPALDSNPNYSPDGRYIAYVAMEKVNYEADREHLVLYDRKAGTHTPLTLSLDSSVGDVVWAPNSKNIYFTTLHDGKSYVYSVDLKGNYQRILSDGFNTSIGLSPKEDALVFTRSYNHMPYEVFSMSIRRKGSGENARIVPGKTVQLTHINADFIVRYELPKLEEFYFKGAEGDQVHGFLLRPPGFKEGQTYPAVLTIHGGPQNMWGDRFMTRWWTFQLIAAPGYVGVFINPRGSTGYGAKFREQVSRNYGNHCYIDLMKGMDYVVETYKFVDKDRLAAVGGSFGGYSVNWIMGHTNRFKCIVSHASLYNLAGFYGSTEELWYPAWDKGETPWDEPHLYNMWSPHNHAAKFKTPTLVTHGEKDYRVNFAESLQLFTALQRQGVPSRLVVFPDEGHVISKPQNNVRWWKEMHLWLATYLQH